MLLVTLLLLFAVPALAQTAEQDAVNALGALDVANKAVRNSVGAYAAEVNKKMSDANAEANVKAATLADWWAAYVKGLSHLSGEVLHDEQEKK